MHRARFYPPTPKKYFLKPQGLLLMEGLDQLKNFIDLFSSRTRQLPVGNLVPQPTTLPRAYF
jgi:hypothetical protein